jgi:hexokinase
MNNRSSKELSYYKKIRDNFLSELIKASKNQKSSISYLRHHFPKTPIIKSIPPKAMSESRMVQAFVIGGTNFSVCMARFTKNGTLKEIKKERQDGTIPIFTDAKIFLKFMKQYISPKARAIGINFAYFLEPTTGKFGEVDGILRVSTKEHPFKNLLGKPVGEFLRESLKKDVPITVVNDTVCLGTNGLVVGTGFNMSLQGVNLECGSFNKFPTTDELETIDKASVIPGVHRFEKFLSGSYLPLHFNLLAKKQKLAIQDVQTGQEISELAKHEFGAAGDLARMLLERSASFVASALAGAYSFVNKKTLTFTTEGSLFWEGFNFEIHVKKQLEELGVPKGAIRFKKIEDSSMQGAFNLLTRKI